MPGSNALTNEYSLVVQEIFHSGWKTWTESFHVYKACCHFAPTQTRPSMKLMLHHPHIHPAARMSSALMEEIKNSVRMTLFSVSQAKQFQYSSIFRMARVVCESFTADVSPTAFVKWPTL